MPGVSPPEDTAAPCPECGTPRSRPGVRPRRPIAHSFLYRWLPIILPALCLLAFIGGAALSVQRYSYTVGARRTGLSSVSTEFVRPPISVADLRALAAGTPLQGPSLAERLLGTRPQWVVTPPGREDLWVLTNGTAGRRSTSCDIGRPFPVVSVWTYGAYADAPAGEGAVQSTFTAAQPPRVGGPFWNGGVLVFPLPLAAGVGGQRRVDFPAILATAFLVVLAAHAAGAAFRHRPRRARAARLAALLLGVLALIAWSVAAPVETSSASPIGEVFSAPSGRVLNVNNPLPTPITAADIGRAATPEDDAALAQQLLRVLEKESLTSTHLLCAAFEPNTTASKVGWTAGYPFGSLLSVDRTRRTFTDAPAPTDATAHWPPGLGTITVRNGALYLARVSPLKTDEVLVASLDLRALAATLFLLWLAWFTAHAITRLSERRTVSHRGKAGRCLHCGYQLAPRSPAPAIP